MKARPRILKSGRRPRLGRAVQKLPRAVEEQRLAEIKERNQVALRLLREALADESGYQEAVWPKLKQALEEDRLSERRRFSD